MQAIQFGRAADPGVHHETLRGMYQLRDVVFRERMRWDVHSLDGIERDEYDELDPIYAMCTSPSGAVEGCSRLLPTTGPYMLRDTFPALLRGEAAPEDETVWELSRFAVAPVSRDDRRQVNLSATTFALMQRAYEFAVERGIRHYVAVTNISFERLLRRIGVPIRRFGDGTAQRLGRDLSVGFWISIDEECRRAVYGTGPAPIDIRRAA